MKITDLFEDASIKRSIKKILKTADPSYPQQRILHDANEYCDGFGAVSTHPVEYYDWHYVERCPTSIIVDYDAMAKWMDGEIKMWAEEGQPDRYDDEINNPIREPVLLVNKHNGLDIVDGRHRVGGAAMRGDIHVPAYIGVPKSWGTAPDKLEESAAPYTQEELERWDVDDLDRMAFGYVEGDVVTVDPDEIKIIWHMDLENPEYKFKQGGMDWVRSVDFSEPLELSVNEEGELQLENGHHRWFASKKLGRKVTGVIDKIKGKPIRRILKLQAEGKIKRPVEESAVSHDTSIGILD